MNKDLFSSKSCRYFEDVAGVVKARCIERDRNSIRLRAKQRAGNFLRPG